MQCISYAWSRRAEDREREGPHKDTGVSLIIRTSGRGVARMDEAMARMDKITNANFIFVSKALDWIVICV